jgi:hypothetical protein
MVRQALASALAPLHRYPPWAKRKLAVAEFIDKTWAYPRVVRFHSPMLAAGLTPTRRSSHVFTRFSNLFMIEPHGFVIIIDRESFGTLRVRLESPIVNCSASAA